MIKRSICLLACVSLVFLVSIIEWDNWFGNPNMTRRADGSLSKGIPLQTIRLSRRAKHSYKLPLRSEAALVLDTKKGEVLFEKNMEQKLPVASLTKLMSALVFLDTRPHLDDTLTMTVFDADCVGTSEIKVGETVTLRDLLHASLISSSNRATKALVRASGLPPSLFTARMNRKAKELGLENTFFCEPTGLDKENISTALDCAKLLYFAARDSAVASILGKTAYKFVSLDGGRRKHRIQSANGLLFSSFEVKGGKTGYIRASGWCLGALLQDEDGKEVAAVILGAPSKHTRLEEIRSIVEWSVEKNRRRS
ncbi:MAG: D-alanyl-D-alanine endopeptidase [candidate division Zixibacteria bacterium]|nr:D-alanyl-D-alanine endopeptidase [candidate division Zixibacteria bacterium]